MRSSRGGECFENKDIFEWLLLGTICVYGVGYKLTNSREKNYRSAHFDA